ncbi:MAG: metal-dependent hydrolase [Thermoplasmata archaeon]
MANLLAHSLLALALHSAIWSVVSLKPLTEYAFLAALVALLPDIDLDREDEVSPYGHSIGYALLWSLLSLSALSFASYLRFVPSSAILPAELAITLGLGSHLILDSVLEPGILGIPRGGRWSRVCLGIRRGQSTKLNLVVSSVATALLLSLVALR